MATVSRRQEWSGIWPLPFTAMLGVAGASTFGYSSGILMEQMTAEFGWSRAQFSSAFTLQMVVGLIAMPLAGRIADRFGVRRVAIIGIVPFVLALSALGLANGYLWQWWVLSLLSAVFSACIAPPIWIKAVVRSFDASRGLAMSIALAGAGLGSGVWPILAALYVERLGWRATFPALALSWGLPMLVLTFFFFRERARSSQSGQATAEQMPPPPVEAAGQGHYLQILKSRTLVCLLVAGGIFSCTSYGIAVHFVPIMRQNGLALGAAAGMAGIAGFFSTFGRIAIGYLLDRLPTRAVSLVVFLLPIGVALLLWLSQGSLAVAVVAAALYGLSNGAESDVIAYLMAQRFGHAMFASIYAVFASVIAVCASFGPLVAGAIYDARGNYDAFLVFVALMSLVSTLVISLITLRRPAGGAFLPG